MDFIFTVNQKVLKGRYVANTFPTITARFFKIFKCTNQVFFLYRMHALMTYLDRHFMCRYSIILSQFNGSSLHGYSLFYVQDVLYAAGAGRTRAAMAMDGMYVVRGHDCMDAGGRATSGAVAEEVRSDDVYIISACRKCMKTRERRWSWMDVRVEKCSCIFDIPAFHGGHFVPNNLFFIW